MQKRSLVIAWLCLALLCAACRSREEPKAQPLPLRLAVMPSVYSGLIAVAADQGLFEKNGLSVSFQHYPSGLDAMKAVLAGAADAGTGADFALTGLLEEGAPLRIVSSIGLAGTSGLVGRRDHGIASPNDLKGKRIGLTVGTTGEYFLDKFLQAHAIRLSEVSVEDIPPLSLTDALLTGRVDGISSWDNYVYETVKQLGDKGIHWPAQNLLDFHWLVVVPAGPAASPAERTQRLLKALVEAERFTLANADKAKGIISRWIGVDAQFTNQAWESSRLTVSLGQALVTSLESCFQWRMKRHGVTGETPNVLNYIDPKPLDGVEPRAITLLR